MNSNIIIFILLLIIVYLYKVYPKKLCKNKINPKDFDPAIHHPAAL